MEGKISVQIYLEFLSRSNNTDVEILKKLLKAFDSRNSGLHSAASFSNAIMHCGTTNDQFLRDNLEWLSRASNWAKFSATAGLGVIHKVFYPGAYC